MNNLVWSPMYGYGEIIREDNNSPYPVKVVFFKESGKYFTNENKKESYNFKDKTHE